MAKRLFYVNLCDLQVVSPKLICPNDSPSLENCDISRSPPIPILSFLKMPAPHHCKIYRSPCHQSTQHRQQQAGEEPSKAAKGFCSSAVSFPVQNEL